MLFNEYFIDEQTNLKQDMIAQAVQYIMNNFSDVLGNLQNGSKRIWTSM